MQGADVLSLLTFNLGLVDLWPFHSRAHLAARVQAIPQHLRACGADVIVLQEVFSTQHRRDLCEAMRRSHPYSGGTGARRSAFGSGLLVLSRHPILKSQFHRQQVGLGMLVERGALAMTIESPLSIPLPLVAVHLEPGPVAGPSRPRRLREVAVMLAAAQGSALLAGDFNCSPVVAPDVYARIIAARYDDVHLLLGGGEDPTWDANNPLNRVGRHRFHASQRIDHVFVPSHAPVRPVGSRIVFQDAAARLPSGGESPISDHCGLLVDLLVPHRPRGQAVDQVFGPAVAQAELHTGS